MHISNAKPLGYPVARTSVKHDRQKSKVCSGMSKTLSFTKLILYCDSLLTFLSNAKIKLQFET